MKAYFISGLSRVRRRFSQDVALHLDARQLGSQTADLHLLGAYRLAAVAALEPAFPLCLDPVEQQLLNHAQTTCRCRYALARLKWPHLLLLELQRVPRPRR